MEDLRVLISLVGTAVGLIITAATFASKMVSSARAKKALQNLINITSSVLPFIEQAEMFVNYTGEEKKQFVMTKANQFAIEKNCKFDAKAVSDRIEELVQLTKEVNKRDKDKQPQFNPTLSQINYM